MVGDRGLNTLLEFRYKRHFLAEGGQNGRGKDQYGKKGKDLRILVPIGTEVWVKEDGKKRLLVDIREEGKRVVIARGGKGGRGNAKFATSTNRVPVLAEEGGPAQEMTLILELKLLADVGIIGLPNAGKSSLLAASSAARPKIADYPFTTLEPVLGVVESKSESFVAVDIPGLIEGAHEGKGLGFEFLRHVERTKVLIHVVDGSAEDPLANWRQINEELREYNPELLKRPQVVAINKIDMPEVKDIIPKLRKKMADVEAHLFFISAVAREGLEPLWGKVLELLKKERQNALDQPAPYVVPVIHPTPRREQVRVHKEAGVFVVEAPQSSRFVALADMTDWRARLQIFRRLDKAGVVDALEKAGIKTGDMVKIGNVELEWD